MTRQALPQRYYDALKHPNPAIANPLADVLAAIFIRGDAEPSDAQKEHFGRLMMVGDLEADNWGKLEGPGLRAEWVRIFNEALERGTDRVPQAPPELKDLLEKAEREPLWLDRRLLDLAAKTTCRVGPMSHMVMRSIGLMGGYMSAPIAKPLVFTGALESGTSRRLTETANFGIDVTRPGGLERNAPGFKTALRVRMMHGIIRKRILQTPGWKSELWGIPINQADMIVTNMTMSYVFVIGHRMLGVRFSDEEVLALLHLWRYVGYLMGIDDSQLPTTEQEARKMLWLAVKLQPGPDEDCLALARALKHVDFEDQNTRFARVLAPLTSRLHNGLSRFALGRELADSLEIPDTPWKYWPLFFAPCMFSAETLRIHTPFASTLAYRVGRTLQDLRIKARLKGREAAYVPAVELSEKAR